MWRVDAFAAFCFPCSLSLNYKKDMFEYILIELILVWRQRDRIMGSDTGYEN